MLKSLHYPKNGVYSGMFHIYNAICSACAVNNIFLLLTLCTLYAIINVSEKVSEALHESENMMFFRVIGAVLVLLALDRAGLEFDWLSVILLGLGLSFVGSRSASELKQKLDSLTARENERA